jgi:hypothetical protein
VDGLGCSERGDETGKMMVFFGYSMGTEKTRRGERQGLRTVNLQKQINPEELEEETNLTKQHTADNSSQEEIISALQNLFALT